ncbi:unnamed protein product [Pseudo-nitzschia multistriata]|uniref:Sulfotransferase domain-containing protein n=1 Tax=Pseudo-nitzschia multistriata TaxID=183589 RepID=A0A448ZQN3_9STRA|nr:unnamed protein product [Pseudo-nitzschia multistriata]
MSSLRNKKSKTTIVLFILLVIAASLFSFVARYDGTPSESNGSEKLTANLGIRSRQMFETEIPEAVIETMDPKMVDFVVAGFQKCGTTYLQNKIFYPSERLFIPHHETHFLQNDKYAEFIGEFENVTKAANGDGKEVLAGYKSPFVLGHHRSLRNLETLFPDIRMIITLRHPISAFQSLYNYKLRQSPEPLPPAEEFVGLCRELCSEETDMEQMAQSCLNNAHWCTGEMGYHKYLSRLGLTPMNTSEELDLLGHHGMSIHDFSGSRKGVMSSVRGVKGKQHVDEARLFLIEIGQFDHRMNQTMADDVRSDLETFLGLDPGDLPRAPNQHGMKRPKIDYKYPPGYEEYVLDICLDQYKPMRKILLETSRKASKWIMEYLLHPSNRHRVIVSNIDIFQQMLEGWKIDPCLTKDEALE